MLFLVLYTLLTNHPFVEDQVNHQSFHLKLAK